MRVGGVRQLEAVRLSRNHPRGVVLCASLSCFDLSPSGMGRLGIF